MLNFIDFIEVYNERYVIERKKKYVILKWIKNENEITKISSDYYDIIDYTITKVLDKKIEIEVQLESYYNEEEFIDIFIDIKTKKIYIESDEMDFVWENVDILNPRRFIVLFKLYLNKFFEKENAQNRLIKNKIGWSYSESKKYKYMPIGDTSPWSDDDKQVVDIKKEAAFYLEQTDFFCQIKNGKKLIIMDIFEKSREAFYLFLYTLHAIYSICGEGKEHYENNVFSVCAYGKNIKQVQSIVNIFTNFLSIDMAHADRINKIFQLSVSSLKIDLYPRIAYHPLYIVNRKTGYFIRSSSVLSHIQKEREKKNIRYFPIFLSSKPIKADEIIDINVDNIVELLKDENIAEIKREINILFLCYISYLEQYLYHNTKALIYDIDKIKIAHEEENVDPYDTLLYTAEHTLGYMLMKYDCQEIAEKLEEQICQFISEKGNNKDTICSCDNCVQYFKDYLDHLSNKDKHAFIYFEGKEIVNDIKEDCFYLECNKFFKDFCQYLKKNKVPIPSERQLKSALKENGLLHLRNNGKQYGVQRQYNDKKVSFLIVYKEKIHLFTKKENSNP